MAPRSHCILLQSVKREADGRVEYTIQHSTAWWRRMCGARTPRARSVQPQGQGASGKNLRAPSKNTVENLGLVLATERTVSASRANSAPIFPARGRPVGRPARRLLRAKLEGESVVDWYFCSNPRTTVRALHSACERALARRARRARLARPRVYWKVERACSVASGRVPALETRQPGASQCAHW